MWQLSNYRGIDRSFCDWHSKILCQLFIAIDLASTILEANLLFSGDFVAILIEGETAVHAKFVDSMLIDAYYRLSDISWKAGIGFCIWFYIINWDYLNIIQSHMIRLAVIDSLIILPLSMPIPAPTHFWQCPFGYNPLQLRIIASWCGALFPENAWITLHVFVPLEVYALPKPHFLSWTPSWWLTVVSNLFTAIWEL